jgi:hypothetical protein
LDLRFQAFAFKPSSVHSRKSSPTPWTDEFTHSRSSSH